MHPSNILFGVLRDVDVLSPSSLQQMREEPERFELSTSVTLKEALEREWETDAHLTSYSIYLKNTGTYSNKICRIKFGPILQELRDIGAEVHLRLMCFDWDTPNHVPWTEELFDKYLNIFQEALDKKCPILTNLSAFYTTKNGARFICLLNKPLLPEEYTSRYRGGLSVLKDFGIEADTKPVDWQRLFRLPKVVRKKAQSKLNEFFICKYLPGTLDPFTLPEVATAKSLSSVSSNAVVSTKPDIEECYKLFKVPGKQGNYIYTTWGKRVKRRLKNRDCFECLFNDELLALEGSRDSRIHAYVGQAVSLVYNIVGSSPEAVYALFFEPVSRLRPDDDTGDWLQVLWSAIVRNWSKEEQKNRAAKEKEDEDKQDSKKMIGIIAEGMSKWIDIPEDISDNNLEDFVTQNSIAVLPGNNFSVITRSGFYDAFICSRNQLIPRIKTLGLDQILNLYDNRTLNYKSVPVLLNDYGTPANHIEGRAQGKGSVILNLGKANSTFVQSLYRRKTHAELNPEFSQDVDSWLRKFFTGKNYHKGLEWIAWSLAFEEGPISALSIVGPPACGKKLLVQGLAECINTEEYADSDEFGKFQHNLNKSPFVVVNEGFSDRTNMPDVADKFRSFISGDPIKLEEKYKAPVTIRSPIRIILTANNRDVIWSLIQHRDLEPADRVAIASRILHVDVQEGCSEYLSKLGNYYHTKGWIKGDDGSRSDYTIAKHFLYLYENRGERPSSRFLVEGDIDSEIMWSMTLHSGNSPQVIECLMGLIKSMDLLEEATKYREGFLILGDKIFVTSYAVVKYYRDKIQKHSQTRLNGKQVMNSLKGLSCKEQFNQPTRIVLEGGEKTSRLKWVRIDPYLLQASASAFGMACDRLDDICGTSNQDQADILRDSGYFE